jgi:hypothetical protein
MKADGPSLGGLEHRIKQGQRPDEIRLTARMPENHGNSDLVIW